MAVAVFFRDLVDLHIFLVLHQNKKGADRKYEQNRGSSASRSFF